MKTTKENLLEALATKISIKLHEADLADEFLPGKAGKDSDLPKYSLKVEKFLDKIVEEAEELAKEGEELMQANILQDPQVGERNRFFLTVIGFVRKLKNSVSTSSTDLRKMLG